MKLKYDFVLGTWILVNIETAMVFVDEPKRDCAKLATMSAMTTEKQHDDLTEERIKDLIPQPLYIYGWLNSYNSTK